MIRFCKVEPTELAGWYVTACEREESKITSSLFTWITEGMKLSFTKTGLWEEQRFF